MASGITSPRVREENTDEFTFVDRSNSPSAYKRFESGAIDSDDVSRLTEVSDEPSMLGEIQHIAVPRPRKKYAGMGVNGCCRCLIAWRRRILWLILICGLIAVVAYFVLKLIVQSKYESSTSESKSNKVSSIGVIKDGLPDGSSDVSVGVNPSVYPNTKCKLPNYTSQNGKIYATGPSGKQQAISIKGINWSGMETGNAIPYGLWANGQNGTTVYEIASFLSRNNFNSVRLPLCVESILQDRVPNTELINIYANSAIDVSSYLKLISSIVKAFAYREISVLLDIHVLTITDIGSTWTSNAISEASFLSAIDTLTKTFCNDNHWNIIGVDLKNEPSAASWGDKGANDWSVGATTIGNRVLQGCPNWLTFIEGVNSLHTMTLPTGEFINYYDWWGGGLQNAEDYPISLSTPNKIVYAPHYYSPSVYPQMYLLKRGTQDSDLIGNVVEWDNATLKSIVLATANNMFGYLTQSQGGAIVLGEFGGLYTQDRHANYTVRRVIEYCMTMVQQTGFAGGYVWSLNPESTYNYNPSDHKGIWQEGLVGADWVTVNIPYLNALKQLDSMPNLSKFPCMSSI
ncbi:cell 5A endo-1,4-betaglucanase [Thraustotheca clavata]|uniref:Cell 5A endo-1,4-betaglucanase n=1 Tax=Thraustotheca clavata TaxID=74557 RepID=A0A1V9YV46_9STRA|nr:cell 5A endo-1,4-betaglucanase [Thraustotheca clavata]